MTGYRVLVFDSFWDIAKKHVPQKYHDLIKKKLDFFKSNPFYPGLNTKPYGCSSKIKENLRKQGVDDVYEFYVNGKKYRCIFYVLHAAKELIVVYIGTHDQLRNRFSR